MKTLFLHLGPPKSGSTYIQTSLELSRGPLARSGIDYPALPSGQVAQGESIFGNYHALFDELGAGGPSGADLLVSGESLHDHLQDVDYLDLLTRLARQGGFGRIACLLLPRDPVEHAAAVYQQRVKHVREARSIETIFDLYDGPTRTVRLVRELHQIGADVTLRRYGAVRERLLETVEDWLGVSSGVLVRPDVDIVNRSLTAGELALQRAVNRSLGRGAPRLTSRMVEQLPELRPHQALPTIAVQQRMLARLRTAVLELNELLPDGEALSLEPKEPATDGPYVFTGEQIDLLAQAIADEVRSRDPFFAWRDRLPWQWAGLARRLSAKLRSATGASRRPNLHRSATHLTRSRGWLARTIEAALVLAVVGPVRRLIPMRAWSRLLGTRARATSELDHTNRPTAAERSVAQAVRSAASWVPFGVTCLDQAVCGSLMLRRRGAESAVVIGLNRLDAADDSHAWLVGASSGAVLVGADRIDEFTPVTEFRRRVPS